MKSEKNRQQLVKDKLSLLIKERRQTLGLTQSHLAEKLEISQLSIIKYEQTTSIKFEVAVRICNVLGIDLASFNIEAEK